MDPVIQMLAAKAGFDGRARGLAAFVRALRDAGDRRTEISLRHAIEPAGRPAPPVPVLLRNMPTDGVTAVPGGAIPEDDARKVKQPEAAAFRTGAAPGATAGLVRRARRSA